MEKLSLPEGQKATRRVRSCPARVLTRPALGGGRAALTLCGQDDRREAHRDLPLRPYLGLSIPLEPTTKQRRPAISLSAVLLPSTRVLSFVLTARGDRCRLNRNTAVSRERLRILRLCPRRCHGGRIDNQRPPDLPRALFNFGHENAVHHLGNLLQHGRDSFLTKFISDLAEIGSAESSLGPFHFAEQSAFAIKRTTDHIPLWPSSLPVASRRHPRTFASKRRSRIGRENHALPAQLLPGRGAKPPMEKVPGTRLGALGLRCSSVEYVEYSSSSRLGPLATA